MQHSHPTEDAFMVPGMGAQPVPVKEWVAANDNVADGKTYPVGHEEPVAGRMDRGMMREKPAPVELPARFSGVSKAVGYWPPKRAGDPNGCADDLVTTTFAPLESVGWFAVQANSPGNSNPFGGIGERHGSFMQTYTGRKFWPMDPRPQEVNIRDIAHSLSMQCRYAGHCRRFYSVAEHSVHIARWLVGVNKQAAIYGLLHDASEAFLIDVPRPVKPYLTGYRDAEERVMASVLVRFGLGQDVPPIVKEADDRILADELVNLVRMQWHARHDDPLGVTLQYWSPAEAEEEFLETFKALGGEVV